MSKQILITGGAGFIGSHLADELIARGYRVRALDNLSPQVHETEYLRPSYLNPQVELIWGDMRDADTVQKALTGIDVVYHFAAMVGVGQSMYEICKYTETNNVGTAVLLEALLEKPMERLIVASSMSIYGEGLYQAPDGSLCSVANRHPQQLKAGRWELSNEAGALLKPVPTPETKQPALNSIYALSKYDQERMCMMIGQTYNIPTVALRFFNTYGTRQALSNPYTGVLAIFASRLLNDNPPLIFEDGNQLRDFVSVQDVAQACRLALEVPEAAGHVFNVASGHQYTVMEAAQKIAKVLNKEWIQPKVINKYRVGDVRHCFADITLAQQILGYQPQITLEAGLQEMADWLKGQIARDRVAEASAELATRGLTV